MSDQEAARSPVLSRRRAIGAAGAGVMLGGALTPSAAASPTASPTGSPPAGLTARQRAAVLRVARAGANVPVRFPSFGESGTPEARATATRLDAALARLDAARLAPIAAAADALSGRGAAQRGRAKLLAALGRLADDPEHADGARMLAALAIATVSRHFDPNGDYPASLWIGGLRHLGRRGRPAHPIPHLEARR